MILKAAMQHWVLQEGETAVYQPSGVHSVRSRTCFATNREYIFVSNPLISRRADIHST